MINNLKRGTTQLFLSLEDKKTGKPDKGLPVFVSIEP